MPQPAGAAGPPTRPRGPLTSLQSLSLRALSIAWPLLTRSSRLQGVATTAEQQPSPRHSPFHLTSRPWPRAPAQVCGCEEECSGRCPGAAEGSGSESARVRHWRTVMSLRHRAARAPAPVHRPRPKWRQPTGPPPAQPTRHIPILQSLRRCALMRGVALPPLATPDRACRAAIPSQQHERLPPPPLLVGHQGHQARAAQADLTGVSGHVAAHQLRQPISWGDVGVIWCDLAA